MSRRKKKMSPVNIYGCYCPICGKKSLDTEAVVSDPEWVTPQHRCKESTLAARDRAMKVDRCEAEIDRRWITGRLRSADQMMHGEG